MRNVTILLAVAAMLALAAPASGDYLWVGDGDPTYEGFYNVAENWNWVGPGEEPGPPSPCPPPADNWTSGIVNQGLCQVNTDGASAYDLFVGGPDGSSSDHVFLEIQTGANLKMRGFYFGAYFRDAYAGTVLQTGGTFCARYASNGYIIGRYAGDGNTAIYKMTGGRIGNYSDTVISEQLLVGSIDGGAGVFHVVGALLYDDDNDPETDPIPGSITVTKYLQRARGTLKMELDDSGAVTPITVETNDWDSVLEGQLVLDATLYTPTVGDRIPVLAMTNSGALLTSELLSYRGGKIMNPGEEDEYTTEALALDAPDDWDLIDDGLGALSVKYVLGDLDEDGDVDQGDLNEVLARWGQTQVLDDVEARWLGDPTCDETVDQGDLNEVLAAWGRSGLAGGGAPVPEPMTMSLLVIGGLGVLIRRRK